MTSNPANETNRNPDLVQMEQERQPKSRGPRAALFKTPEPAPETGSDRPAEPTTPPSTAGESPSGSESSPPEPPEPKSKRREAGASSARLSTTDRKQLKEAIKAGVRLAGVQAHQILVRDEVEAEQGLWLTTEQDEEGLSEPLSAIAARHAGPGALNPDLGDAIAALIALVTYLSRNLNVRARIRAWRRGQVDHTPPEEPAAA